MRVLLTGGAGYIGSHVAVALSQAGHLPFIVDNFSNSSKVTSARLNKLCGRSVPVLDADLRDEDVVSPFIRDLGPIDAVIHLAGLKAVGESVSQPLRYYETNLGTTFSLLRLMKLHGIENLVFSSSATVYGMAGEPPYGEDAPTGQQLTNPYGRTKHMIEEVLRDASAADPDLKVTALRYFNPVGAHESGLIGEDPSGMPNNLLPVVASVAAGEVSQLTVYGGDFETPDGTGVRDYVHVWDLARGHVSATVRARTGYRVVNLGGGRGASVLEVVRAYETASGRKIPYTIVSRRAGDVAVSIADTHRAKKELGWTARLSLADACHDDWRWRQEQGRQRSTGG